MSINSGLTKLRFHILSASFDDENSFHTIALKYYNKNENKKNIALKYFNKFTCKNIEIQIV